MPILDHTADRDRIEERLRTDVIAWLGSVRPDGRPHLVPVWFYWDGEVVLVLSQPKTQKVRNLTHDHRVTIALDDTRLGRDVVLFEGEASLLSGPSRDTAPPGYLQKYAGLLAEMQWPVDDLLADYSQVISVRPTRFFVW
jgi:PPOX class probable F420-dependent enzyme